MRCAPIFRCSECGERESINLLDSWDDKLFCIACYPTDQWQPCAWTHFAEATSIQLMDRYEHWIGENAPNTIVRERALAHLQEARHG